MILGQSKGKRPDRKRIGEQYEHYSEMHNELESLLSSREETLKDQASEMLWLCHRIKWLGLTKTQLEHLRVDELEEKANKIIQDLKQ